LCVVLATACLDSSDGYIYAQLRRVYRLVRLHANFFLPGQKLVSKHRDGARVRRVYDRAQTP
jgi:hypothetical protein